jgi:hypothetical protein
MEDDRATSSILQVSEAVRIEKQEECFCIIFISYIDRAGTSEFSRRVLGNKTTQRRFRGVFIRIDICPSTTPNSDTYNCKYLRKSVLLRIA